MNETETSELKALLEPSAKDVKVLGTTVESKTDEQKQIENSIEQWKQQKSKEMIRSNKFEIYKHYIKMVINKHMNSLICISKTGYGKTFTTINLLKDLKQDYVYKSGYITSLSFFHFLYKNRDKFIVLDDLTNDVFKDKKMVALLKACLYETDDKRFISYDTTSKALDVPNIFEFTGSIIILANETGNRTEDENFKALISRSIFYELNYSFKDILRISDKILLAQDLTDEQRQEVRDIIKEQICEVSGFNLRQLGTLIQMVKYNPHRASELFSHSFQQDSDMLLVSKLMKLRIPVKDQAIKFTEETGFSNRKYYRLKQKIKKM